MRELVSDAAPLERADALLAGLPARGLLRLGEPWETARILIGLSCVHPRMSWCCPRPCGHLVCPDCGLAWDVGAER